MGACCSKNKVGVADPLDEHNDNGNSNRPQNKANNIHNADKNQNNDKNKNKNKNNTNTTNNNNNTAVEKRSAHGAKGGKIQEKMQSRAVDDMLRRDMVRKSQELKLLFLGAGESGKSTLFKQLVQIFANGFTEDELMSYTDIIYANIIEAIQALCVASDKLDEEACRMSVDLHSVRNDLMELKQGDAVTPMVAEMVQRVWNDPGVQRTYARRSRFQLSDGAVYYFRHIERIAEDRYIPTFEDVLRCRARTTGIIDRSFVIGDNVFRVFDVGGQRNERKKWLHCFEQVTAVIFVAALSGYDQMLFEDDATNRVVEALNLFHEICNSRWFMDTNLILFLNKRDLFYEKLATAPITVCFSDFHELYGDDADPHDYETCCDLMQEKFESQNLNDHKQVYTHVTCATDTNNVAHVFNSVKDMIIRESLTDAGLV